MRRQILAQHLAQVLEGGLGVECHRRLHHLQHGDRRGLQTGVRQAGLAVVAVAGALGGVPLFAPRALAAEATPDAALTDASILNFAFPNGLVFARTPARVLNVVYLGGKSAGFGFFPDRLNGAIN
ncbi:MAG: Ferritin-like domain [Rhodospirillales bacterium]|nr:Ferritin-like domain [Rhodospirillales bacterium]